MNGVSNPNSFSLRAIRSGSAAGRKRVIKYSKVRSQHPSGRSIRGKKKTGKK